MLIFLSLMAIPPNAHGQENEEGLRQRFLQEGPTSWNDYVKRMALVQGKIVDHRLDGSNEKEVQTFEYRSNGRGKLCIVSSKTEQEDERHKRDKEVYGANPQYAFRLQRTSADAPWAIIQIVDLNKESLPRGWSLYLDSVFRDEATQLVRLGGQLLSEIIQSEAFRMDRCRAVQRDGKELVEVSFTYERDSGSGSRAGHLEGTLLLDPERFWCLRSTQYTVNFKNDPRFHSEKSKYEVSQLAETSGSLPVPKQVESDRNFFQDADRKVKLLYRSELDLDVPRRLPDDEEFTLSAFGLPEPPGLEWKKPTPWYLWLGLAGIVCLGLGVGVRKVLHRRTANT